MERKRHTESSVHTCSILSFSSVVTNKERCFFRWEKTAISSNAFVLSWDRYVGTNCLRTYIFLIIFLSRRKKTNIFYLGKTSETGIDFFHFNSEGETNVFKSCFNQVISRKKAERVLERLSVTNWLSHSRTHARGRLALSKLCQSVLSPLSLCSINKKLPSQSFLLHFFRKTE